MTKKKNPIADHKEEDLILGRQQLIDIISDDSETARNKIEAVKLLARMHKALQPDKTEVKAVAQQIQAQALPMPELKPELKATLKNLLNAKPS